MKNRLFKIAAAMLALMSITVQAELPDFYSEPGIQQGREYQADGSEAIDPFGGGLQRQYVDAVFPSNGMDIVINRAYSSAGAQAYKHIEANHKPGAPTDTIIDYLGWTMHFGRLILPYNEPLKPGSGGLNSIICGAKSQLSIQDNLIMEGADGSQRVFVVGEGVYSGYLVTSDRWRATGSPIHWVRA